MPADRPALAWPALRALAEALCFLDSHNHPDVTNCEAGRRRADTILVALEVNPSRALAVGAWLVRDTRLTKAPR